MKEFKVEVTLPKNSEFADEINQSTPYICKSKTEAEAIELTKNHIISEFMKSEETEITDYDNDTYHYIDRYLNENAVYKTTEL